MRKITKANIIILALLFVSLLFCRPPKQEEAVEEESFAAAPVKVFQVKRQKISEKLFYTGLIKAWKEVNVTSDVGGKIAKIYVEEGARVKKGQLLAELDTRATRLQQEQARAGLAVTEANYKDAKRNLDRMERLSRENAVSEQQYEKIKLAFEAAEAQLQQARATLNLADHQLNVSLMKAPFSGVVASKNAEVGDVINPMMGGFSPNSGVLTLMDFSRVKIEIDVSHQDVGLIKKGQGALLGLTAFPNRIFQGRVTIVNLTAGPLTKKFKVEVEVDNPGLELRPNTFGEVTFEINTQENALVIPQKAVLEHKYVFLVNGNKVKKRDVVLGLQNAAFVEVVSGLDEGDSVVVEGNYGLEEGSLIDIKEVIK